MANPQAKLIATTAGPDFKALIAEAARVEEITLASVQRAYRVRLECGFTKHTNAAFEAACEAHDAAIAFGRSVVLAARGGAC